MSKVKIVLNRAGVRELLRSPEMAAMLKERADSIKERLPDGYVSRIMPTRAIAIVETATEEAYADNLHHNTLLKKVHE